LETYKPLLLFTEHKGHVTSVAISRDGNYAVSGSGDKSIKIWELKTGKVLRTLSGHEGSVYFVAISPDEEFIASCSYDGTIRVWGE